MIRKRIITTVQVAVLAIMVLFCLAGCGQNSEEGSVEQADAGQQREVMSFETVDLEGNEVSSSELFSENSITMVNVWGTFCGPCIGEMPDLEKINKEYSEKGAGILGVVIDVPVGNDEFLEDGLQIQKDTGVTFRSVRGWAGVDEQLSVTAIPTTFFVNSKGEIVDGPIVGANIKAYRDTLDKLLR